MQLYPIRRVSNENYITQWILIMLRKSTNSDYTVVIQGPLSKPKNEKGYEEEKLRNEYYSGSIYFIESYYKQGFPILISTWESEEDSYVLPEVSTDQFFSKIKSLFNANIIEAALPKLVKGMGYDINSTFYWAVKSQYNAFKNVKTKYVIKTRTDEGFYPLSRVVDLYEVAGSPIMCGNIFCKIDKPDHLGPYHMGDHIYMCETKVALKSLELILEQYERKPTKQVYPEWMEQEGQEHEIDGRWGVFGYCAEWCNQAIYVAERILAHALVRGLGYNYIDNEVYVNNFSVFDVNALDDYICRWARAKQSYFKCQRLLRESVNIVDKPENHFHPSDHNCISHIREYRTDFGESLGYNWPEFIKRR